jgi:hypothetical protein
MRIVGEVETYDGIGAPARRDSTAHAQAFDGIAVAIAVSRADRVPSTPRYCKMLTARAMTSPTVLSEIASWASIVSFVHGVSGRTSVGLNAVALVNDT